MSFFERADGTYGWMSSAVERAAVPAYLIGQYGSATSPDTTDITPPNVFTIKFRIQGPINDGDVFHTIASHWDWTNGWVLRRANTDGTLWFNVPGGFDGVTFQAITPGADEWGMLTVIQDDGAGNHMLIPWTSPDGEIWTQGTPVTNSPAWSIGDPDAEVTIGELGEWGYEFHGRIYTVEFRAGLPAVINADWPLLWYFNADDWPGYGLTWWTEGRPWTVSSTAAMVVGVPFAPAEVCPSEWEMSHARKDIVTKAVLGRDDGGATPQRVYNDPTGQEMYGVESPFQLTDLVAVENSQLDRLADRLFRTRGKYATPRVEAVTIDARNNAAARDLLTLVDVYEPSRYRCRHVAPRGVIFDTTFFATGITHRMTPDEWTARISLDLAGPWMADGARFDQAEFDNAIFGA